MYQKLSKKIKKISLYFAIFGGSVLMILVGDMKKNEDTLNKVELQSEAQTTDAR